MDEAESRRAAVEVLRRQGVRPNKPAYFETPLLSVGKQVRVTAGGRLRRATIDCVDDDAGTVDVVCVPPPSGWRRERAEGSGAAAAADEEEFTLPAAAVRHLEEFEAVPEDVRRRFYEADLHGAAAAAKDAANGLFKQGDYEAAAEHYGHAIAELEQFRPTASAGGGRVLVRREGAMVLGKVGAVDAQAQTARIVLRRGGQDEVLEGVPWRMLIAVHPEVLQLQSSLHMNRARALMQGGFQQEAGQDLSLVIGLWASSPDIVEGAAAERSEQLVKAHYLRAKARLSRMRIEPARADLREAWALEPPEATAKLLRQLEREVEVAQREQVRSNKRLAKEIAKLADVAFQNLDQEQLEAMGQGRGSSELC